MTRRLARRPQGRCGLPCVKPSASTAGYAAWPMVRSVRHSARHEPEPVRWGLRMASAPRAARVERGWRLPVLLSLASTVPAFYAELLDGDVPLLATLAYLVAAMVVGLALTHTARRSEAPLLHLLHNPVDLLLVVGLVLSAVLPPSAPSAPSLGLRLGVSLVVLMRMLWAMQHLLTRGGLAYLLLLALAVLGLCGAGFWYLEPTVHTLGEGLWLAFTTAATVGYGDMVPTVPAARIFAVFVVLLGFGVLSTVTAAIATSWIETEERRIERELMDGLQRQIGTLETRIVQLSAQIETLAATQRPAAPAAAPARLDG